MIAAIAQTNTGIDPDTNAELLEQLVARAKAEGADMLFTPEMSGLLDRDRDRMLNKVRCESEDVGLARVRNAAAKHGLWVHMGSLAIRDEEGALLRNRSYVIDANGNIRARYDKIHLFDVDLPTGESYRESSLYRSGTQAVIADTPWGKLGLSICYDLRFPELYERLVQGGATMFSIPAAFTATTGEAHWHVLLRARAVESGVYVIASAQTGLHEDGRRTYGHSVAIDPWGRVLLDMGEAPGLAFAPLDPVAVTKVRSELPSLAHRRPIASAQVMP